MVIKSLPANDFRLGECGCPCSSTPWTVVQHDGPDHLELLSSAPRRRPGRGVSHGLQPQSPRMTPTAALSEHVFGRPDDPRAIADEIPDPPAALI